MDLTTVAGLFLGTILLILAIVLDGDMTPFLDLRSILLVLGGTFGATLITHSHRQILNVPKVLRVAFQQPTQRAGELVDTLVALATRARREGLLALEDAVGDDDDPFLRTGIQLVVDGADPEMVRNILEIELDALEERHRAGQQVFETLGTYAPAFGMLGTLVGLIQMLRNLSDPEAIGPGMALALLTTLYGAILAYLIFNPIAGKLKNKSVQETRFKEVIIEGILSIQAGENPRMIERKLWAFLGPQYRNDHQETQESREPVTADV